MCGCGSRTWFSTLNPVTARPARRGIQAPLLQIRFAVGVGQLELVFEPDHALVFLADSGVNREYTPSLIFEFESVVTGSYGPDGITKCVVQRILHEIHCIEVPLRPVDPNRPRPPVLAFVLLALLNSQRALLGLSSSRH